MHVVLTKHEWPLPSIILVIIVGEGCNDGNQAKVITTKMVAVTVVTNVLQWLVEKTLIYQYLPTMSLLPMVLAVHWNWRLRHCLMKTPYYWVSILSFCAMSLCLLILLSPLKPLFNVSILLTVPRPGFPLYQVITESHGASVEHYNLLPDKDWECDLDHMESILVRHDKGSGEDGSVLEAPKTTKVVRGILVNNPSNPTGAVYREEHLLQIIELAEKYRVPIIADEIYGDMTFERSGKSLCPMANVAARMGYSVPIVTASGLGKQCEFRYLMPRRLFESNHSPVWIPHIICFRSSSRMETGLDCLPGQSMWCNPGGQERRTSLSSNNIGFESSCPNGYSCCIGPFQ